MIKTNKNPRREKVFRICIAITLAIVLWVYVNGTSIDLVTQDLKDIPVTLTNTDTLKENGLVLSEEKNYYVNLKVKGTEKNMESIDLSKITAEADLQDATSAGTYTPKVVIKGLPNSIGLDEIRPEALQIQVEKYEDKEQDVSVTTSGKPDGNLSVISATSAEKVKVTGDTDKLAKVAKITAVANVQGITADTTQYLDVSAVDSGGNVVAGVECAPRVVRANLVVGNTKTVTVTAPKTVGDVSSGYKVTGVKVTPTTVTIGGKQESLDAVSELSTSALGVAGATASVTGDVQIKVPDGITLMGSDSKVSATATVEALIEKSYTIDTIDKQNVPADLKVTKVQDSSVFVTLQGTASELKDIDTKDLSAWVDLNGKTKGTYDVLVQVKTPKGQVKSVSPDKTTVTLDSN